MEVTGDLPIPGGILRATIVPGDGRNQIQSARFAGPFRDEPPGMLERLQQELAGSTIDEAPAKIEEFFAENAGALPGVDPSDLLTVLTLAFMKASVRTVRRSEGSTPGSAPAFSAKNSSIFAGASSIVEPASSCWRRSSIPGGSSRKGPANRADWIWLRPSPGTIVARRMPPGMGRSPVTSTRASCYLWGFSTMEFQLSWRCLMAHFPCVRRKTAVIGA